jgi:hypothetical protein
VTADTSIEIVTDCSTLPAVLSLWMLGVVGVLSYYGMNGSCSGVVVAGRPNVISVSAGELQSSLQFHCRDVYVDRTPPTT